MNWNKNLIRYNPSVTRLILDSASFGVGAYHGYHHAAGVPFEEASLEWWTTYGPAVVRGGLNALIGGSIGLFAGGLSGVGFDQEKNSINKFVGGMGGAIVGASGGIIIGGAIGSFRGGFDTLLGYGVGYLIGSFCK